jgi:hypothetical protein
VWESSEANDLLLAHPASFIAAAAEEKLSTIELSQIVGCEPEEFFAVECRSEKCRKAKKAGFRGKETRAQGRRHPPARESDRQKVLEAFRN